MKQRFMIKKLITAFVITTFLSVSLSAAEAAPSKKGERYPYPSQQQSQQNSRPPAQHPRPGSPRPSMQQPRPNVSRPSMQQSRPSNPRPKMQQPRPQGQRPAIHQSRTSNPRTTVQQVKTGTTSPSMKQARPSSPRPSTQQSKSSTQLKTHDNRHREPRHTEVNHERPRPKINEPKKSTAKPSLNKPKHSTVKPSLNEPKQNVAKPGVQKTNHREHRKPGPRKDLYRPPVQRTYENMNVWRRAPKPPKDYWWNHRPAHRWGRYREYYNGIYYTDVLSALLAADIIHYSYDTSPYTVINNADYSTRGLIPKEAVKYKGHHYLVFSDIGDTMEDAQQFCESMGGHLATVGDDGKNERLYRLINDSGFDNESFEKFGHDRMIPNEPVTYVKAESDSNSEADEEYYGLYYWSYKNMREDGASVGTGGNAFVCEWDM